jgi:hypothetical protein
MTVVLIIVTLAVAFFIAYKVNKTNPIDKVQIVENTEPDPVDKKTEKDTEKVNIAIKEEPIKIKKVVKKTNKKTK